MTSKILHVKICFNYYITRQYQQKNSQMLIKSNAEVEVFLATDQLSSIIQKLHTEEAEV